jgi:uncharacterized protein YdbL (DUF1318 family)
MTMNRMRGFGFWLVFGLLSALTAGGAAAQTQADLEINTPAIRALTAAMKARHDALEPHYRSGALGQAANGEVVLRDASQVPLAQRAKVNALVAAENADRAALYREIARANGHPEWQDEIRATFAERFIARAPAGWWVERAGGWERKQ